MEPDQPQPSIQQLWEVHPSPYGVPYYYNPKTKESRWTVPTGPLDRVVPKKEVSQKASVAQVAQETKKEPEVECISSSCSSTSESDDVPNPLSAAERAKLKVENFKAMLQEQGVQAFDSFNAWLPRLLGDARFTAVPKSQRRKLFQSLAQSLGEGQRKLEADSRRQGREGFLQLLELARSQGLLESASVATAMAELERHFAQDGRWTQLAAPERQRLVELQWADVRRLKEEEEQKAARAWRSWLLEKVFHPATRPPAFDDLPMTDAASFEALPVARRRAIYEELAAELARKVASEKKAEADEEDDLLEKRKRSRLEVAEEDFRSLLAKKIRSPLEFNWKEMTMVLDGEKLPELDEVDLETIFNEVKSEDLARRLDAFSAALLRSELVAETSLQEAIQSVEMEEYLQAVPQNELKKRWEAWRRFRVTEALDIFAAWLRQEPALYEAQRAASPGALEELCKKLESDLRYRRLDWVPSQRMKIITRLLDIEPSDAKCCKPTCSSISCPAGKEVPPAKADTVLVTEDKCCDTVCAGYTCGKGWQADPLKATKFGNTDQACCTRTCAKYECSAGWAPNPDVASFVGVSDELCCKKKCSQYQDKCTGDYAPNLAANDTVGDTAAACCSRTCALHSCSGKMVVKPEPKELVGATDADCCEDAICADFRKKTAVADQKGCNGLSKEECTSSKVELTNTQTNKTDVLACKWSKWSICALGDPQPANCA